jgi:hypothetical protein
MLKDRVDDHRDRRLGVLLAAVYPDAAGDLLATAVGARLRSARTLSQLQRDVLAIDANRGRAHKAQRPRLLRGLHENLADLDLDAGRLEHLTHNLERRREAPVGPQAASTGGEIEEQEVDPPRVRGLGRVRAGLRLDGHLMILSQGNFLTPEDGVRAKGTHRTPRRLSDAMGSRELATGTSTATRLGPQPSFMSNGVGL